RSGGRERHAAEAVVAAKLEDYDGGVERSGGVDARHAAFGGIAADAEIDDAVCPAVRVDLSLELIGEALSVGESVAGAEAVAKDGDDSALIARDGRRSGPGIFFFPAFSFGFSFVSFAVA